MQTSASSLFTKIRYRKASDSGLISYLPIDDLDYCSCEDAVENSALTGFSQTSLALVHTSTPESNPNVSDFGNAAGEISHTQALRAAGPKNKSKARLLTYQPNLVMSYNFIFEIADSDLGVYSIVDKLNMIQIQK